MAIGSGTRDDPWHLTTRPGTSSDTMYRDDSTDPPQLVCPVGSTTLLETPGPSRSLTRG